MIKKLCYLFFLLNSFSLFSQDIKLPESIDSEDLRIEKETWNIGVSSFSAVNLDSRYEYLLSSLPLLVQDEISSLSEHILQKKESLHLKALFLKQKTISLEKEKSLIHKQRDSLLFSELAEDEIEKKYDEYSQQIKEKEELIIFWNELDAENLQLDQKLVVSIQNFSEDDARLLAPRVQVQRFMESDDIDLLISGSVERLEDMFYLKIEGIMQHEKNAVFTMDKLVTEEEINAAVAEAAIALRTVILGRTWSELQITALPSNTLLLIDGDSRGVGVLHIKDLEPGFVTISANSTGFKSDVRQIYLPAGETQSIEIKLEEGISSSLSLFSEPPGADVYFGSLWVGQTPLYTEKPKQQSQIKISKDNFMPFYMDSSIIKGDSLTVELGFELFDKQQELEMAKSKFYRSLGWFSLSVALPLVLSGVYQNLDNRYYKYAQDYNSTANPDSYDKALEYKQMADITYYSFWGGIAISGGLLINTFFKLRDYIRAADISTED